MAERGLLGMIKGTPITPEICRVLGGLWQEPGTKAKYIFFITSHICTDFLPCTVKERILLTLVKMVRKTLFRTVVIGVKTVIGEARAHV